MRLFTNLTPLIPAPYQGEGRYCIKRCLASVKLSYPPNMGVFRGALAPQKINLPLPLIKGKGIQGIGLINKLIWQRLASSGRMFEKEV